MKSSILLLALSVVALSSCTTAYKTGQTPDDVYFSPVPPKEEYVRTENKRDDRDEQQMTNDYYDDRYLRMKVHNRTRWTYLDDWYYYGNRYQYTSYNCCCYNNPWTPYSYWNNYYNPYYHNYVIVGPKSYTYSRPRTFNLSSYNVTQLNNRNYTNKNSSGSNNNSSYNNGPRYNSNSSSNTRSRNSNAGNVLRSIFNGSNSSSSSNNNNSSSSNNNNSSSSTSSSSSSSSSSSGSSAPVRRF